MKGKEPQDTAMEKRVSAPVSYEPGVGIEANKQLRAWLKANESKRSGKKRRMKIPVVIVFKDPYRLSIGDAFIGDSGDTLPKDALSLSLDDTALGIPLLDTLNYGCPKDKRWCALWLEGVWGQWLDTGSGEAAEDAAAPLKFSLLRVGDFIGQTGEPHDKAMVLVESIN